MNKSNKLNESIDKFDIDIEQTNTLQCEKYQNFKIPKLKNTKRSSIEIEENDLIYSLKFKNKKTSSISIEEIITI